MISCLENALFYPTAHTHAAQQSHLSYTQLNSWQRNRPPSFKAKSPLARSRSFTGFSKVLSCFAKCLLHPLELFFPTIGHSSLSAPGTGRRHGRTGGGAAGGPRRSLGVRLDPDVQPWPHSIFLPHLFLVPFPGPRVGGLRPGKPTL